nr:uncharacterized protein LOC112701550 [Arachis hypogaea]
MAFDKLKTAMTHTPALFLLDFSQTFTVETYAYNTGIGYRPKKQNQVAVALFRHPETTIAHEFMAFTSVHLTRMEELLEGNQTDPAMLCLHHKLKAGKLGPDYIVKEGLLMYQRRVWVPDFKRMRELLLQEFHLSLRGGHGRILKTYKDLGESFFWHGMRGQVHRFVERCQECQVTKYIPAMSQGLLQPLPILAVLPIQLEPHNKLWKRYYGPYNVIQKVGNVAYGVAVPGVVCPSYSLPCVSAEALPRSSAIVSAPSS